MYNVGACKLSTFSIIEHCFYVCLLSISTENEYLLIVIQNPDAV